MNIIKMIMRIDQKNDRTKTSRFPDEQYIDAIRESCLAILKERVEPIRTRGNYSVQSTQRLRDELYTLIPPATTITPVANVIAYPTDYYYYLLVYATISGVSQLVTATDYNKVGTLTTNPFTRPSATKPYFNESSAGLNIIAGGATATSSSLTYVKMPAKVSIGYERNKVTAGTTLAAVVYYVFEDAIHSANVTTGEGLAVTAGQVIQAGETFTGTVNALTSGVLIPATSIVNCDFPENMHEEICTRAAAFMQGTVEDERKKQSLLNDAERS
jgi:hypothetical protein